MKTNFEERVLILALSLTKLYDLGQETTFLSWDFLISKAEIRIIAMIRLQLEKLVLTISGFGNLIFKMGCMII